MTLAETLTSMEGRTDLTASDAMNLRRQVFSAGQAITQPLADRLFQLNDGALCVSQEWRSVFVEILTDFALGRCGSSGRLEDATAEWLMSKVSAREIIRQDVVELLIRILEETQSAPWTFAEFVLLLVKDIILWNDLHHRHARAGDVERLRRVLFAQSQDGHVRVSPLQADALFDLNEAFISAETPQNWPSLFVQAIAEATVFESVRSAVADKTDLAEAGSPGTGASTRPCETVTNDVGRLNPQLTAALAEPEPGHWLVDRLSSGPLNETGLAILQCVSRKKTEIDPRLWAFIRQEGLDQALSPDPVRLRA